MSMTTKPLRVALCDDDKSEREYFVQVCKRIKETKGLSLRLKEYESGDALLFDFADEYIMSTVDIVLLDINMPGSSGVEVARTLREKGFQGAIIFITKSEKHWRDAFDIKAFHYITKDQEVEDRFATAFLEAALEAKERRGRSLLFSASGETRKIEVASITHFEVMGYIVRVHYRQEQFEFTASLKKIEELLLGNEGFVRVNRSCILALPYVEQFDSKGKKVTLKDGHVIPVAPKYIPILREALKKM